MGYPGGKNGSGVYQAIINQMPPHRVYVEPFLGGGAIMRLKRPAEMNIGIDLDQDAVHAFSDLVASPESKCLQPRQNERAARSPASPIPANGVHRQIKRADPNAESSDVGSEIATPGDAAGNLAISGDRYRFFCRDAIAYLREERWGPGTLIYCDPPYLHSTRPESTDLYKFEMTDAQHVELLEELSAISAMVMISGYHSPLYSMKLRKWRKLAINTVNRQGHHRTEYVWSNFPEPTALHDYRYLGSNFRERERINRKKKRWVAKLSKMPLLERQALLGAIGEAWEGGKLAINGRESQKGEAESVFAV
jgi:DNA adenine methylase